MVHNLHLKMLNMTKPITGCCLCGVSMMKAIEKLKMVKSLYWQIALSTEGSISQAQKKPNLEMTRVCCLNLG